MVNYMFYNLNNFFLFSIFGYFFETLLFKILNMHNQSGFMYLWWTPFYGTGVIIANLIYKYISKRYNGIKKYIILAITLFISLTLLEFTGGVLLELLHGYSLWTYEKVPLHIGKYISVPTSILWVLMESLYLFIIKKYSDKLVSKIPKWITIVLSLVFISDFILTVTNLIINRL